MKPRLRRPRPAHVGHDLLPDRPSGGQLTALVVGLAAALLLAPVGAQAAERLANVVITDPADTARQAHVDATGNLQVAGSVNVANTPLAVTSADDPGRLPFQKKISVALPDGSRLRTSEFTVPAGKRLVIRYVSGLAGLPLGQRLDFVEVATSSGGSYVSHYFLPVVTGSTPTGVSQEVAQDTQLYADPGTRVIVAADRTGGTGDAWATVSISGYLIDCAVAPCG